MINMKKEIEINKERLTYLIELFKMNVGDLHELISKNGNNPRKKSLHISDIYPENSIIKLSILKQIDKIFKKGLHFYTNPDPCDKSTHESVFFRTPTLNTKLEHQDYAKILELEEDINHINHLLTICDIPLTRILRKQKYTDDPVTIAELVRDKLKIGNDRLTNNQYKNKLLNFTNALAKFDIPVIEFIEHPTIKYKTNFEGLTISNFLIIKHNTISKKREIFTLAHELGHYILNQEAFDNSFNCEPQQDIERWCNTFAINLLLSNDSKKSLGLIRSFNADTASLINNISNIDGVSELAIYLYLYTNNIISWDNYIEHRNRVDQIIKDKKEKQNKKLKSNSDKTFGRIAKPIQSEIVERAYRMAYLQGAIEEYEVVQYFKPNISEIQRGFFDNFIYGTPMISTKKKAA
ncbi:MAG: ImmA/IrrE family metallo-endopeptidase [Methylacidiphilales bacterium]|nr:ImmA/IrrE family metallo-endopeptidase [Candidatus Methylacidiphilales bacterium]